MKTTHFRKCFSLKILPVPKQHRHQHRAAQDIQHPLVFTELVAQTFPSGPEAVLVGSPLVTPLYRSQIPETLSRQALLMEVVSISC